MHITGNELAIAATGVAALAVIAGLLGTKFSNNSALKIAREERASRNQADLDALKRAIYTQVLSSLNALAAAKSEDKSDLAKVARDRMLEMQLISPLTLLRDLANEALYAALDDIDPGKKIDYFGAAAKLQGAFLADLQGVGMPDEQELQRLSLDRWVRGEMLMRGKTIITRM